jgi:hypothetical protein
MHLQAERLRSVPLPTASLFPTKKGIANGSNIIYVAIASEVK